MSANYFLSKPKDVVSFSVISLKFCLPPQMPDIFLEKTRFKMHVPLNFQKHITK